MAKKTAIPGIYKVTEGILINKDNDALRAYKARKKKDRLIEEVQNEVNELRKDISDIKNLLFELLGKKWTYIFMMMMVEYILITSKQ